MRKKDVRQQVAAAMAACQAKKADDIAVLQLSKNTGDGFTDYFVICSGGNPRQIQAISDEVEQKLAAAGLRPAHIEGYRQAEWVLLDYVDFVVHIFQEKARRFYDLERLWKAARRLSAAELLAPRKKKKAKPAAAAATRRTAGTKKKKKAGGARAKAATRRTRHPGKR